MMSYQFHKASVLVVDDMQPMLALTTSLLRVFGFVDIHQARTTDQAFDMVCRYDPDIILADWLMEPYDGIAFTRKIRSSDLVPNRFVPIIMMTGFSHAMRVEDARDAGVNEFLVKPFRSRDLYARIEQLIEKPRRFVETEEFFGPDRRRRKPTAYQGPFRRQQDHGDSDTERQSPADTRLLQTLTQQATDTRRDIESETPAAPVTQNRKRRDDD